MTSAHKKGHDYHLVDPSPWPILTSFALLAVTGGAVMSMHQHVMGIYVLALGLLSTFYCAGSWWADVIKEGKIDRAHTVIVKKGISIGMALFILSEVMFFFAFFWSYFEANLDPVAILDGVWGVKEGVWPPEGITTLDAWNLPFMNTLILLLSGTTVTWAHYAILNNNRNEAYQALAITVSLGVLFTCLQVAEYSHATFTLKDGIYPSNFYMATGFHGLHVMIGTIFLAVCMVRTKKGHFDKGEGHLGFEFAAWYWHFVDVVWLFLFIFVYVLGS